MRSLQPEGVDPEDQSGHILQQGNEMTCCYPIANQPTRQPSEPMAGLGRVGNRLQVRSAVDRA
ncbi:hypothetical protein BI364_12930 [Acidihalobacter yilgarnensis]|uniref:Uncharacterized protein n=1 Tax=Acidihalobacter yilgarnensis TaxID=2819280 RepID=A0A1D8IQG4_9GAMM|nr:hypothetical protein BI364_12930 [Acidihalobacter yilgarnensis]